MEKDELTRLRKTINVFSLIEIILIALLAFGNLAVLILNFYTGFRGEGKILFSIDMLISIFVEIAFFLSMSLAVIGRVRSNFFLNKWSLLVLFIGELLSSVYTLISALIVHGEFVNDIFQIIAEVLIIAMIAKEMTSLYAPEVTKFIFRFSLVLLLVELGFIAYLSYAYLHGREIDNYDIMAYVIVLVTYIIELIFPSALIVFYPRAIKAEYELEDEELRKEALGKKEETPSSSGK